jgi:hypothetical protein
MINAFGTPLLSFSAEEQYHRLDGGTSILNETAVAAEFLAPTRICEASAIKELRDTEQVLKNWNFSSQSLFK